MSCSSTNTLLVGTRFNPTDEELLSHYLKEKMLGKDSPFPEIDYCKYEPCDLIALLVPTKDMERFFYSPRHKNRKGFMRATEQGSWKPQGNLRGIKAPLSNAVIGNKRILTFYKGRPKSKTNYIMHEYAIAETELGSMPRQNGDFVLCRLKINPDKSHKKKGSSFCEEADPAIYIPSNFENLPAADDMIVEQDKELEDPLLPNDSVGKCKESQDGVLTGDYGFENLAAADDMIAEQEENLAFKELLDILFPNGNVGECKESQKDSCLMDDISTWDYGFENQAAADDMITEQEENLAIKELQDILFLDGNVGECSFSDFEMQQAFAQLESLLHPTQPQEQQDYCSSTLPSTKEAHLGNVPLADANNGECSWGKSPLGDNDSCLTNKNKISINDNHEPVSNMVGSAADNSIRKVFTQPGGNLEPLNYHQCILPRDVLYGNNYIASNESQSQFGDSLSYLETTPSPSIDSNLPKSLGTQYPFNYSFQGNSALATGEKHSDVANEPQYFYI